MTARPPPADRPSAAQLSRDLIEATELLVCVVNAEGRILLANTALERFTGHASDDLVERLVWDVLVIPQEAHLARAAIADAMAAGNQFQLPREVDWLAAAGVRRRVALHTSVLLDATGQPYATAFVGSDVTEQREREALNHRRANTDPLTGIGNRRVLFQALHEHLNVATGRGCGLLFCDVDAFKQINDRHGHAVGDQLLVQLAARLAGLAVPGYVVARLGGDEFVVLTPGTDPAALRSLARLVARSLRAPVPTSAGLLPMGVSVGSAVGRAGENPDELVARADRNMYGMKTHRWRSWHRSRPRPNR